MAKNKTHRQKKERKKKGSSRSRNLVDWINILGIWMAFAETTKNSVEKLLINLVAKDVV